MVDWGSEVLASSFPDHGGAPCKIRRLPHELVEPMGLMCCISRERLRDGEHLAHPEWGSIATVYNMCNKI